MDANDYALAHGVQRTRLALESWSERPIPVLSSWVLGGALIGMLLLASVIAVASIVSPDLGFTYLPAQPHGAGVEAMIHTVANNSLVLALHAVACIAGFIAGSTLPLSAERRSGISRLVHEKARPIAFTWVVSVTLFSLVTQAYALGVIGSTLAWNAGISAPILVLTVLPHALIELTAVFLPLAAWTIASRRDEWDQLLAATVVTVTMAIPMLFVAAAWEVHVWPQILDSLSPVV
jgi:Stage II sporulation protein M